jgi:hypothetical protein
MATAEAAEEFFRFSWVYSAKFLCGDFVRTHGEGPVQPGRYSTAINVHNPNGHTVPILKKAIVLYRADRPEKEPEQPTAPARQEQPIVRELKHDWGLEIDCLDIRKVLLQGVVPPLPPDPSLFIKGWVVIETLIDLPLDVVAVYTVEALESGPTDAPSIAMDRIQGTRVILGL